MAKRIIKRGSTGRVEHVFLLDSTSTTGAGKTGVLSTGVTAYYVREIGSPSAITLTGAGVWTEIDATNLPGLYRVQLPDNAFTDSDASQHVTIMFKGTGFAPVLLEYDLVAYNPQIGSNLGLSALPTANHSTSGGLLTYGTGNGQIDATTGYVPANTTRLAGQAVTAPISGGVAFSNTVGTGTSTLTTGDIPTAASVSNAVWNADITNDSTASPWTANSMGRRVLRSSLSTSAVETVVSNAVWNSNQTQDSNAVTWANDTFGKRILRASSNTRADLQVNGAVGVDPGRVASDVYVMQSGVIGSSQIAANAIGSSQIAANAIGASQVATDATQEVANAVWSANITNDYAISPASSAPWGEDSMGRRVLRSSLTTSATQTVVADAVWKANNTTDSAAIVWPDGTFGKTVIHSYNNGPSAIKTAAGQSGGHIAADVHDIQVEPVQAISDGVWTANITNQSNGTTPWANDTMGKRVFRSSVNTNSTEAQIADGVWDEALSGHLATGSTGAALNAAGAAGDPWSTSLPGVYGAGTAGYLLGTNLDARVSTRSTLTATDVWAAATRTLTGSVTVGTNNDKTGYSLAASQSFSTSGSVGSVSGSVNSVVTGVSVASIAENAITGTAISDTATSEIAGVVWNTLRGTERPANSFGDYLDTKISTVNSAVGSVSTTLGTVATDVSTIKSNTDTVESVTNKLDTTLQLVTGTTNYRFTSSALSLAPTGGAGSTQYVPVTLPLGTNARQTLTFNAGASLPLREDILQEQDRTPLDLSTANSVVYELMSVDSSSPKVYATATVVDAAAGRVRYTWQAGDLDEVGTYRERWIVTFPTGQTSIFGPLIKVV